ncbi:hypothetical protein RDABS01_018775 [Bienertia sinuspersici]
MGGLGFRSMRQANVTFLSKLGWRFLAEPNSLWSRVIRQKYGEGKCSVDISQHKQNASNVWRGMVENVNILKKGVSMAVGNGKQTLFWQHSWAGTQPLIEVVTRDPPTQILDCNVRDMWDHELGWNWDVFADYFPSQALQCIDSFELQQDDEEVDQVYWNGEASELGFCLETANPTMYSILYMAALHRRLMSNAHRFVRHLTDDPRCNICGANEESVDHILRQCLAATAIWRKFPGVHDYELFVKDFDSWLVENGCADNTRDEDWPIVVTTTLWWIWKWRNKRCFESEPIIPVDQIGFIMAKVGLVKRAIEREGKVFGFQRQPRIDVYVRWEYPREGWVRLNTDGASKGNPRAAGAGAFLRGHCGEIHEMVREANRAANWLANFGVGNTRKVSKVGEVPRELRQILEEDMDGVSLAKATPAIAA